MQYRLPGRVEWRYAGARASRLAWIRALAIDSAANEPEQNVRGDAGSVIEEWIDAL